MSLSTYLLYLAAVALLVLSPGPTMLMCMTNSLQHGPRKALAAAAGSVTAVLGTMLRKPPSGCSRLPARRI
jgi:threonine/homoserine/homoserine lactone efflux protein